MVRRAGCWRRDVRACALTPLPRSSSLLVRFGFGLFKWFCFSAMFCTDKGLAPIPIRKRPCSVKRKKPTTDMKMTVITLIIQ